MMIAQWEFCLAAAMLAYTVVVSPGMFYRKAFQFTLVFILLLTACSMPTHSPEPLPVMVPTHRPTSTETIIDDYITPDKLVQLEDYIKEIMQLAEIPGVAIAVVQHEKNVQTPYVFDKE